MNLHKMAGYNKLERLRRYYLLKKIWLFLNCFVFMPFYTWLLCVYIYPKVTATQNTALQSWYEFWVFMSIFCYMVYDVFVLIRINDMNKKIESIEFDIDHKRL